MSILSKISDFFQGENTVFHCSKDYRRSPKDFSRPDRRFVCPDFRCRGASLCGYCFVGAKAFRILSELANAPDMAQKSVVCREKGEVIGIAEEVGVLQRGVVFCVCRDGNINVGAYSGALGSAATSEGALYQVAQAMMRLAAQLDYRSAAAELKHQGIEVSHCIRKFKPSSVDVGERWYVS